VDGCLILVLVSGSLLLIAALRRGDRQSFVTTVHKNWQLLVLCTVPFGLLLVAALLLLHVPGEGEFGQLEAARVVSAKGGLTTLTRAVRAFHLRSGVYPDSLEALAYPADGAPFVEPDNLRTPWGEMYDYDPGGLRNRGKEPDIWFVTPKGELIGNWMLSKP